MKGKIVFQITKYLVAAAFIIFGANKLIGFIEMPLPPGETAQNFFGTMFASYLGKLVGITEVLGGILLLIPKTRFLGLLVLAPIVLNITAFHIAHDFPGNPMWMVIVIFYFITCYGDKDRFDSIMK